MGCISGRKLQFVYVSVNLRHATSAQKGRVQVVATSLGAHHYELGGAWVSKTRWSVLAYMPNLCRAFPSVIDRI